MPKRIPAILLALVLLFGAQAHAQSPTAYMEFTRTYGGGERELSFDAASLSDGTFIIAGYAKSAGSTEPRGIAIRVDASGNLLDTYTDDASGTWGSFHQVTETAPGEYAVHYCYGGENGASARIEWLGTDRAFPLKNGLYAACTSSTAAYGIYIGGVYAYALDGTELWHYTGPYVDDFNPTGWRALPDGLLLSGIGAGTDGGAAGVVLHIGLDGALKWRAEVPGPPYLSEITVLPDGGYLVMGSIGEDNPFRQDGYAARLDSAGQVLFTTTLPTPEGNFRGDGGDMLHITGGVPYGDGFLVVAEANWGATWLFCLAPDGSITWDSQITGIGGMSDPLLLQGPDGIYLAGTNVVETELEDFLFGKLGVQ